MNLGKEKRRLIILTSTILLFLATVISCMKNERETRIEAAAVYKQEHSFFEDICFEKTYAEQQNVKLFKVKPDTYYVLFPKGFHQNVKIIFQQFEELTIDDKVYTSGKYIHELVHEQTYDLTAKGWDGESCEHAKLMVFVSDEIPSVFINLDSENVDRINASRAVKEKAKITVLETSGEKDISERCTIKSRGNSSYRDISQKSYNIKLDSEASVLGFSSGTEWALLANYREDLQQLKNKISFDIAKKLGMKYTPDSCFVNLYIDGQYNGLYLLAQRVSADGGSVRVHDLETENEIAIAQNIMPENMSGGYLLEFDIRGSQEEGWFPLTSQTVRVKSPEKILEEELTFIMYYMKKVEYILHSEHGINADTGETYQDCMDMESWMKMFLMQEFFVQWDAEFSSFYMYKEIDDPLIYAGPIWDFDLAYGSVWEGNYPQLTARTLLMKDKEGWLAELDRYPEFHKNVLKKYREQFAPVLDEYITQQYEMLIESLRLSYRMNAARWNFTEAEFEKEAKTMYEWILARKEFWDEYAVNEEQFVKVLFHFDWGTLSYYAKKDCPLNYLPKEIYGQIDKRAALEYDYGSIIGWQDAQGNLVKEDELITEETDFYAVYKTK